MERQLSSRVFSSCCTIERFYLQIIKQFEETVNVCDNKLAMRVNAAHLFARKKLSVRHGMQ